MDSFEINRKTSKFMEFPHYQFHYSNGMNNTYEINAIVKCNNTKEILQNYKQDIKVPYNKVFVNLAKIDIDNPHKHSSLSFRIFDPNKEYSRFENIIRTFINPANVKNFYSDYIDFLNFEFISNGKLISIEIKKIT